MSDLISQSALIKAIRQHMVKINSLFEEEKTVVEIIEEQPTIEAVPVVHGEWIKEMGAFFPRYICSACREKNSAEWYRYCPSCGAKMKGGIV